MKTLFTSLGLLILVALSMGLMAPGIPATRDGGIGMTMSMILQALAPPLAAVLGLSTLLAASGSASGSTRCAVRGLLKQVRPGEEERAAMALARIARLSLGVGLSLSLAAAAGAYLLSRGLMGGPGNEPAPYAMAMLLSWSLAPAGMGIAVARLWIAPTADLFFARTGSDRRSFAASEDLALFVMIIPAALTFATLFLKASTL